MNQLRKYYQNKVYYYSYLIYNKLIHDKVLESPIRYSSKVWSQCKLGKNWTILY